MIDQDSELLRRMAHYAADLSNCRPESKVFVKSIVRQSGKGVVLGYTKRGTPIIQAQGGAQVWRFPLQPIQYAAGTAVTAAALTSGLGGISPPQLPPMYLPGARLDINVLLEITSGSATPTNTLDLRMGSVGQAIASKTILAATSALALPASVTAGPAEMRWWGRIRAISPSAMSIYGQGWVLNVSSLTAYAGTPLPFPVTQAARTVSTLNSDQVNELDLGVTLSATTGTPSVTVADFAAELSG